MDRPPSPSDDPADELLRFAGLVAQMRAAQARYFKGDRAALIDSKNLEWQVDRSIKWIRRHRDPQGRLFPEPPPRKSYKG